MRLAAIGGPLALFLLCVAFHWKLVLSRQYTWLDSPDAAYIEAPRMQFQAREWGQGHFPWWDPHQWGGQPLIGQMTGAAYPLNWPFFRFEGGHTRIRQGSLHWYIVLVRFLAGLNAYALCRYLGRSRPAAVGGGMVYALAGFLIQTDWLPMMNGAVWAPLVFLFLLRAVDGVTPLASAALSGTALGLSWLSGHHEPPLYISLAAAATWLWFCFRKGKPDWALVRLAAVALVFMVLTSGLQTLPAQEFGRLAVRWAGVDTPLRWNDRVPYTVHLDFSFTPSSLLGLVVPPAFHHVSPFLGATALLLLTAGLLLAWRHWQVRLFAAIGLGGLLLAMAGVNVLHGVLYAVLPFMEKARVPARAVVLFSFAAAPLVAYGFDALIQERGSPWLRRLARAAALFGGGVFAVALVLLMAQKPAVDERTLAVAIAALLTAALLATWRRELIGPRLLIGALLLIMLAEFGNTWQNNLPSLLDTKRASPWKEMHKHDDVAQYLRAQTGPLRVEVSERAFPANFGDWYGIDTLNGFAAGVTANIYDTMLHNRRIRDLLAVTHSVGHEPAWPGYELVYQSPAGLKVFRNPAAFPRVWSVHEITPARDRGEMRKLLEDQTVDLRRTAIVPAGLPALEQCGGDEVRLAGRSADRVTIDASLGCRGLVVLADTWFPGWIAEIDGRPAAVHEVYGALRGVVVEAGKHRIEMSYRPRSVLAGGAMTALGLLGSFLLWWRDRVPVE